MNDMVFSGVTFLFYFLPAVLVLYACTPVAARNAVLFAASVIFYVWGSGWLVAVLFASVAIDYVLGFVAERASLTADRGLARVAIAASVSANLLLLGWFKYAGWFLESASSAGLYTGAIPEIVLPIGISFFTFQSMSYTIDVARGRCRHLANPVDFGLYVTLFPQLIAGPIVRYHEIDRQIRSRVFSLEGVGEGALRFGHGLAKKVLVADTIAPIADSLFGSDPATVTTTSAWVGVIAYTLQIYFDFSGYSDMAIGLGRMFGFTFPENFNRPYSALSVTDFWRRWHITLSNWFRDYVYIPLGGSHTRRPRDVQRNLLIVFLLVGLWHGANWTFVVWGAYHGAWLLRERRTSTRYLDPTNTWVDGMRRARTLLIVMVGWVFFRAESLGVAANLLRCMFTPRGVGLEILDPLLTTRATVVLLAASTIVLFPRDFVVGPRLIASRSRVATASRAAVMTVALPMALLVAASGSFSPFLYFQF